jgi:hypothetical protein
MQDDAGGRGRDHRALQGGVEALIARTAKVLGSPTFDEATRAAILSEVNRFGRSLSVATESLRAERERRALSRVLVDVLADPATRSQVRRLVADRARTTAGAPRVEPPGAGPGPRDRLLGALAKRHPALLATLSARERDLLPVMDRPVRELVARFGYRTSEAARGALLRLRRKLERAGIPVPKRTRA